MKRHWLYLLLFLPIMVLAEGAEELRYQGYVLEPRYATDAEASQATSLLNQELAEWRTAKNVKAVSINNNTLAAYLVELKKESFNAWSEYRRTQKKLRKPYDPPEWQAVSLVTDSGVKDLFKKVTDLFPTGHHGRDYYGCIELEPVFAAPLIEGRPETFFAITGRGHHTEKVIRDHLSLTIFDSVNNKKILTEHLMLANYILEALDPGYTKKSGRYDYLGMEPDNGRKELFDSEDGRGRKQYAKLYAADFDENNKLELIFWHRQYMATEISKPKVGMIFEKEWFTAYEENAMADGFNKKELSIEQGHQILEIANLGWKDGYPKDNTLCPSNLKYIPMMPLIHDSSDIGY